MAERTPRAGRYQLRERIGEGAMGVVYAAFDPQLQRKLAVKFVVPHRDTARGRDRLLREAQAMARVNHPNVVSVYDAGETGGQVFIAMDYVSGVTLGDWLRSGSRTWRDVVAIFVQAGRGLAAAHAAGLIHRDFKPDNVLVDERGVARVVDFGLVRPVEESTQGDDPDVTPPERVEPRKPDLRRSDKGTLADDTLTQTGAVVGTPAYMAPEQAKGLATDPRSDQFSFCVALFEGLYSRRPYALGNAADSSTELLVELGADASSEIPDHVNAAIRRGLSPEPDGRWPSMQALITELERTRSSIPWRSMLAVLVVAGVAALTATQLDELRAWWEPVTLTFPVADALIVEPMALHTSPGGDTYAASTQANQGRLELHFELPSAGRYYLHGLVWEAQLGGERGDPDSFFVYVDGGEEKLWHFGCQNQLNSEHVLVDNWAWQPVLHMANADSDCAIDPELAWDLDAGPHRIVLRNREDATSPETAARVARVVITNQGGWRP
ncbi:serine/threonine-protein kinase [Enhygromyxa salina]|uniref:serine/threonine-protein kinase n=1 Tax=Enhygromyxa salina TaxID=215803 RepID=UPI0011B20792|nr:serine/threonine-protein kinase [Enhygromyxa salina]